MQGRSRPHRRNQLLPQVEALDGRVLLSGRPGPAGVGPYLAPAVVRPRVRFAPVVIDAMPSVNKYLTPLLGSDSITAIKGQALARNVPQSASLSQRVIGQKFINTMLGNYDTYQILNSEAMKLLVGYVEVSDEAETAETTRYVLRPENIQGIGSETTLVEVPPSQGASGFFANVPTRNVRQREDGFFSVDIPVDQIPDDAPPPQAITIGTGALSDIYATTGPTLSQALLTGQHRRGPNAAQVVRGLRLARYLSNPRLFPNSVQHQYLRLMRVAVERNAFGLVGGQAGAIQTGLDTFLDDVAQLQAAGVFNPDIPPPTQSNVLAGPSLDGTLVISAGVLRDLKSVAPGLEGLALFGLNFPGRIDAGYVIAPNGDYGLILTARGPMQAAPDGFDSADVLGGDVRVEVSDATRILDLNGLRHEEGTFVGTVLSGQITASRTPGRTAGGGRDLRVLGGSVGYGTGFQFGTGISYTRVIPLGNLNALIPQSPRA